MNSQVRVLSDQEIHAVNGGHGAGYAMLVLGIPHIVMGIIEFINYFGDRIYHGCDNIEDNDYVGHGMCNTYQYFKGFFTK